MVKNRFSVRFFPKKPKNKRVTLNNLLNKLNFNIVTFKRRVLFTPFTSRSVITGGPSKGVGEIGIAFEMTQRITFEGMVTVHNKKFLPKSVDDELHSTHSGGYNLPGIHPGVYSLKLLFQRVDIRMYTG